MFITLENVKQAVWEYFINILVRWRNKAPTLYRSNIFKHRTFWENDISQTTYNIRKSCVDKYCL